MTNTEFHDIFDDFVSLMNITLNKKAHEYAPYDDRLSNLKAIAALTGVSPERAAFILASKHIVSIADLLVLHDQGAYSPIPLWREKLIDIANYLIIIQSLLIERFSPVPPTPEDTL